MKGHHKYIRTKIQMAVHGRRKAECQVTLLQGTVENLREEMAEMRQLIRGYHGRREDTPNGDSTPLGSNRVLMSGEHEEDSEPEDYELESNINPDEDQEQILMNRRVAAPRTGHQGDGKEVILISLTGASNTQMAKATVQTTDPRAIVGGTVLGKHCYEVVMKRDAPLYRPYGKNEDHG
uniref:Transposase Tnp1/En/Spm-like domain-containing protein n=2 Tax=Arundo donax TaxID=35708 RepID=A0A0A9D9V8_ARUDO